MKRLDKINKENIFKVPEGYFEKLPTLVQTRVARKEEVWTPIHLLQLKYVLPVLVITIGSFWLFKSETKATPEQVLASVNSIDLAEYLLDLEITNDDFLESLDYDIIQVDSLNLNESEVLFNLENLDNLLDESENEL